MGKKYSEQLPTLLFDEMGYPSEEYLKWIEDFNPIEYSILDFINILCENWNHGNIGYRLKNVYKGYRSFELHTFGCSFNEAIINSLNKNLFFFALYWVKTERGGHYFFSFPIENLS